MPGIVSSSFLWFILLLWPVDYIVLISKSFYRYFNHFFPFPHLFFFGELQLHLVNWSYHWSSVHFFFPMFNRYFIAVNFRFNTSSCSIQYGIIHPAKFLHWLCIFHLINWIWILFLIFHVHDFPPFWISGVLSR